METRTINQTKIYYYIFNTFGRAQEWSIWCYATTLENLKNYIDSQLLEEPQRIDWWLYTFKEWPLRHYNYDWFIDAQDTVFWHWYKSDRIDSNYLWSIQVWYNIDDVWR
jgi:hypothetical protein